MNHIIHLLAQTYTILPYGCVHAHAINHRKRHKPKSMSKKEEQRETVCMRKCEMLRGRAGEGKRECKRRGEAERRLQCSEMKEKMPSEREKSAGRKGERR